MPIISQDRDRGTPGAASGHVSETPWSALRRDAPSLLLAVTLLLVPLYRTRVLEDSFNTPKLALVMVLGVLTAIGLLARAESSLMKLQWYPAPWLILGLAVWQALSVLWADSKPLGVDGTVYFATFAVMGWLFYRGPRSLAAVQGLFWAGASGAAVTAAWVLVDDFSRGMGSLVARLPDWRGYLAAGLGNSGHIAGMVGMFLPWVLMRFLFVGAQVGDIRVRPKARKMARLSWLLLPVIFLMFAAMAVTWSVGSAGATIISLLTWAVVAWVWVRRERDTTTYMRLRFSVKRFAAVMLAGVAVLIFYFTSHPLNPHKPTLWAEAFGSDRWEAGWPTRLVIWKTTWQMIEQDPMVGMGTGNFTYNYVQQVVPSVINDARLLPYSGSFTNDAHNDYLQLWAEGGVVALALWMAALSTFYVTVGQLLRRVGDAESAVLLMAAGAGLTVFALDGLMSFPMRLPAHFLVAMFFISVPGVLRRFQAIPGSGAAVTAEHTYRDAVMQRKFVRRLRTGGVGILLTLAACVWHHGHRIIAEYYLKAGRSAVDSALVVFGGQPLPAWMACDAVYQQTLQAIASGAPREVWQEGVDQMQSLSAMPAFDDARELFEKSQGVDRWYANASSRLGQLLLFEGEYGRSMEVARRTMKTLQAYEVHERMGAAAFFEGKIEIAREHWTVCLTRRPEQEEFYRGLLRRAAEND